jgi:DNA repair photolyase
VFVRWDNLLAEGEEQRQLPGYREAAVVRRFDAPEAMDIRFYEVHAKSILNRVPKQSRVPFPYTINPYRGCTHACNFCFARPTHTFLDFNAGRDFEREIVVKVNAPELARVELSRPSWKHEHVAMGTNTDPYQWVEGRYKLMPGIWEALRDTATPCSVLTKSPLVLRDLDLIKEVAERAPVSASFSVPTLDEKVWRETEPHTPHPRARLEAVAEVRRAGIPSSVLIAPLMPGVNDSPAQVEPILELAAEAGATNVLPIALHLRGEVKGLFFDWLREHRPELVERYEQLYPRGAYMSSADQGRVTSVVRGKARNGASSPMRAAAPHRGAEGPEPEAEPGRPVEQSALF